MTIPYIINIQKFSIHDGPGIRTTVFFKGCPIRCAWCHNPESQKFTQEEMKTKDGTVEIVGTQYALEDLVKELQKDQLFYEQSGGGVTLSGGEVMAQPMTYITALVERLEAVGISVVIDTSGEAPYENFQKILPYASSFLYDLKFFNPDLHRKYIGKENNRILDNLKRLSDDGAIIHLRLIQLDGLNNHEDQVKEIQTWLKEQSIQVDAVNLLPYHEFGSDKYARLHRQCEIFKKPSEETLEQTAALWRKAGYRVAIGG